MISKKVDGLSYSSNGCTISRSEGSGWEENILEKSVYMVTKQWH